MFIHKDGKSNNYEKFESNAVRIHELFKFENKGSSPSSQKKLKHRRRERASKGYSIDKHLIFLFY